ncbi:MAG TPA: hypothetical protein VKZ59_14375 [Acidobacteriota bacterium]|nr:hypothetical protein [Acidobacteriota bacterium]
MTSNTSFDPISRARSPQRAGSDAERTESDRLQTPAASYAGTSIKCLAAADEGDAETKLV